MCEKRWASFDRLTHSCTIRTLRFIFYGWYTVPNMKINIHSLLKEMEQNHTVYHLLITLPPCHGGKQKINTLPYMSIWCCWVLLLLSQDISRKKHTWASFWVSMLVFRAEFLRLFYLWQPSILSFQGPIALELPASFVTEVVDGVFVLHLLTWNM